MKADKYSKDKADGRRNSKVFKFIFLQYGGTILGKIRITQ